MAIVATGQRELTFAGNDPQVASEEKLNSNSERIRLILTNTSSSGQVIRVGVGNEPSTSLGIPLYAGGSIEWNRDASLPIQQKRVIATSPTASATLAVYEEVINKGAI